MTQRLPAPHEAQQLSRLRALRVQRARERCAEAQAEVDMPRRRCASASAQSSSSQREIGQLGARDRARPGAAPAALAGVVAAQRERLADRLERDEYALVNDEHQCSSRRKSGCSRHAPS